MAAQFPSQLKVSFGARRQDRVDIVEADDVNEPHEEIVAIEQTLGRNPHVSTLFTGATTMAERLAFSDALLRTIRDYFDGDGRIDSSQVRGLSTSISTLQSDINTRATTTALSQAISGLNTSLSNSITNEANARASKDTDLQNQINALSGAQSSGSSSTASSLQQETTQRQNADTNLQGQINALANRVSVVEIANRRADLQASRSAIAAYNSSASYQDLKLDRVDSMFNDFSTTLYDPSTGFFYCQSQSPTIMAMSATISWTGTGGSSGSGIRGLRLITAGGSVLTEFVRNPASDASADKLSITWIGRLTASSSYYVKLQVLQNSGGPLNILAHSTGTPTVANWTRQSG